MATPPKKTIMRVVMSSDDKRNILTAMADNIMQLLTVASDSLIERPSEEIVKKKKGKEIKKVKKPRTANLEKYMQTMELVNKTKESMAEFMLLESSDTAEPVNIKVDPPPPVEQQEVVEDPVPF